LEKAREDKRRVDMGSTVKVKIIVVDKRNMKGTLIQMPVRSIMELQIVKFD